MDNAQVTIQIQCENLPGSQFEGRTGVRLGIQKGDVVIEDVACDSSDALFTASFKVSINPTTGKPNFTGPFAHGNPQDRFIYLCWGERKGVVWEGFRRAKLPLYHLSRVAVENAIKDGQPIKVVVNMTDNKGEPLCASVKDDKMHWEL